MDLLIIALVLFIGMIAIWLLLPDYASDAAPQTIGDTAGQSSAGQPA